MAENRVNAEVGFSVVESDSSLSKISEQISKINAESQKLAQSLNVVENAVKQFGVQGVKSQQDYSNAIKKTKSQITEEAKQQTKSTQDVVNKNRAEYQKDVDNNRAANEMKIQDNRAASEKLVQEEKRKAEAFKTEQVKLRNEERLIYKQKLADLSQSLAEQRRLTKANTEYAELQYRQQLDSFQDMVSKMKKDVNSLSKITNMGTKSSGNSLSGQMGRAIANAGLTVTGIRAVVNQFANVSSEIVEIEKNVINIQRIMGDNSEKLSNDLLNTAIETAKATATQVTDVQEIQSA